MPIPLPGQPKCPIKIISCKKRVRSGRAIIIRRARVLQLHFRAGSPVAFLVVRHSLPRKGSC